MFKPIISQIINSKYSSPSTREWNNSIYSFNKNVLKTIPVSSNLSIKLIKSYFNLYNYIIEKKVRRKKILLRLKRLSLNKIFISNGEFKHTNNKVITTIYLYNRQNHDYVLKLKKQYLKTFKYFSRKLNYRFNISKYKSLSSIIKTLSNRNTLIISNKYIGHFSNYISKFYKILLKRRLIKVKKYLYYKQLLFINKSKHNYIYLQYLKNYLEIIYNKNVEFNLIDLKRFFFNSDILSNVISIKLTKNRRKITRYLNKLNKKIKIKNELNNNNFNYNIKERSIYKNIKLLRFFVFNNLKHKYITGYRLEAKGRLTRRYTASRSRYIIKYKGNLANTNSSYKGLSSILLKGNLKSNIEYTKLRSKTRIGSFGIKGWISGN